MGNDLLVRRLIEQLQDVRRDLMEAQSLALRLAQENEDLRNKLARSGVEPPPREMLN